MITRFGDRRTFAELRRRGRRARSGPVSVCHLREPADCGRRVAYAVGGQVGNAVHRNRLRRRLRAAMGELMIAHPTAVGPGAYLIAADPGALDLSYRDLVRALDRALDDVALARTPGVDR